MQTIRGSRKHPLSVHPVAHGKRYFVPSSVNPKRGKNAFGVVDPGIVWFLRICSCVDFSTLFKFCWHTSSLAGFSLLFRRVIIYLLLNLFSVPPIYLCACFIYLFIYVLLCRSENVWKRAVTLNVKIFFHFFILFYSFFFFVCYFIYFPFPLKVWMQPLFSIQSFKSRRVYFILFKNFRCWSSWVVDPRCYSNSIVLFSYSSTFEIS